MIDLYTWSTPNGRKVSIMLEAIEAEYRVTPINILKDEQFAADFLNISPNNKIPAIVDSDGPNHEPISVFESGAILLYLAEKSGKFIPSDPVQRTQMIEWLMWQMGSFGPFLGQAHHFNRFAPEKIPYAIQRYNTEARRLWAVLDKRLINREFIVDDLCIADFAIYPWTARYEWQKIDLTTFPHVKNWMQRMESLKAVQKGMVIPA